MLICLRCSVSVMSNISLCIGNINILSIWSLSILSCMFKKHVSNSTKMLYASVHVQSKAHSGNPQFWRPGDCQSALPKVLIPLESYLRKLIALSVEVIASQLKHECIIYVIGFI